MLSSLLTIPTFYLERTTAQFTLDLVLLRNVMKVSDLLKKKYAKAKVEINEL